MRKFLVLLIGVCSVFPYGAELWKEENCPVELPFSYCLVYKGPTSGWCAVDLSWKALAILVHPGLIKIVEPHSGLDIGLIVAPEHTSFTGLPALSSDGKLLATPLSNGTVCVWQIETGRQLLSIPGQDVATFSCDSALIAVIGMGQEIAVWNINTGVLSLKLQEFQPAGRSVPLMFSPDGKWFVSAIPWWTQVGVTDRNFLASAVWDVATGRLVRVFPGPLLFLPDGILLVYDWTKALPTVSLWEGPLGGKICEMPLPRFDMALANITGKSVSPDGKCVALSDANGTVYFWKWKENEVTTKLDVAALIALERLQDIHLVEVAFSPDGKFLLTALWDSLSSELIVYVWYVLGLY